MKSQSHIVSYIQLMRTPEIPLCGESELLFDVFLSTGDRVLGICHGVQALGLFVSCRHSDTPSPSGSSQPPSSLPWASCSFMPTDHHLLMHIMGARGPQASF